MQRTNFKMEDQNITMIKGDTLAFNCEAFDETQAPVTLDSAFFTCKKDPIGQITVFQKALGSGIVQVDGLISVRVAPEDTLDVEAGRYFYDFVIGVNEDVFTIMRGILTIEQDVTF